MAVKDRVMALRFRRRCPQIPDHPLHQNGDCVINLAVKVVQFPQEEPVMRPSAIMEKSSFWVTVSVIGAALVVVLFPPAMSITGNGDHVWLWSFMILLCVVQIGMNLAITLPLLHRKYLLVIPVVASSILVNAWVLTMLLQPPHYRITDLPHNRSGAHLCYTPLQPGLLRPTVRGY